MAFHEFDIVAVGDFNLVLVLIRNSAELDIGVVEHGEYLIGCASYLAHLCKDVFLRLRQYMSLLSKRIFDGKFIFLQAFFLFYIAYDGIVRG